MPSQAPSTHGSTSKRRWTPSGASVSQEAATSGWVAAPRKLQKKAKTSFSHLATRGTPKVSQLMSPPVFFSPPQFPSPAAFTLPPSAYVPPPDDADTMPPPVILSRTPRMQPARPTARRLTPNSSGRSARALSDECAESGEALPPRLPLEQGVLYDAMHGGGGGTRDNGVGSGSAGGIEFIAFDFHKACSRMRYGNIGQLLGRCAELLHEIGRFEFEAGASEACLPALLLPPLH